jgi:hypothetical protein
MIPQHLWVSKIFSF